jgi:hypothetical protein
LSILNTPDIIQAGFPLASFCILVIAPLRELLFDKLVSAAKILLPDNKDTEKSKPANIIDKKIEACFLPMKSGRTP